jgi:formate dehydrogenase iron-sulfur subunit
MDLSRRKFLKVASAAGAVGVIARPRLARASTTSTTTAAAGRPAQRGMLVDTTLCAGCRGCEAACSEANGLPAPVDTGNPRIFNGVRVTDQRTYTVVNRFKNPKDPDGRFVKKQCMHCVEPACASACLTKALEKLPEGPVIYHKDRCLGCRYCMVACPFEIPKYEYDKASPYVQKCTFCIERQRAGKQPACASVCPNGALLFGNREELLDVARLRVYQNPEKYVHHIYGETEVAGTSWLYITDVPFENLGFKTNLGHNPYSALTQSALSTVPMIMTLWPPLLMGMYTFAKRKELVAKESTAASEETRHE